VWKSLGSTNILKEVWEGIGEGGEKEKEGVFMGTRGRKGS